MLLTREIGEKVISRVAEYIGTDINMMNLKGEIIASTDSRRIGEIHTGAKYVIATNESLTITVDNIAAYIGTKEGVNLPITHRGKMTGVVGVSGDPIVILPMTGLVRTAVELVLDQLHLQREIYNEERQWNDWLQQLFHSEGYDPVSLKETAMYVLKINLDEKWRVLVLKDKQGIDSALLMERLQQLGVKPLVLLTFRDEETLIIINKDAGYFSLFIDQLGLLYSRASIGVGDAHYGLGGIRKSYFEAKQVIHFSHHHIGTFFSQDWHLKRLITTISHDEFTHICQSNKTLLIELGEEYRKTLEEYLKHNLSIKETSEQLHIHRNTLLYRLEQLKQKVGLDPRRFEDAIFYKIILEYEEGNMYK